MNRYLLLRDNKQSGPYSVPELIEKGIKAYDLVWLDGKSAAWRYPSEIDELKAYAPIVEEQPFDRFYKKPTAEKHFAELAMATRSESGSIQVSAEQPSRNAVDSNPSLQKQTSVVSTPLSSPEILNSASGLEKLNGAIVSQDAAIKPIESTLLLYPEVKESGIAEGTSGRSAFEPVPRNIPPVLDGPRKIYVTLPGVKPTTRINPEVTKSVSASSQSDNITERPLVTLREEYRDAQSITGKTEQNQNERINPAPRYKKVEAEYKKPELSDTSFSSKFAGADLLTDTVFPVKYKKSIFAAKQHTIITIIGALCLLLGGIIIGLAISNSKKESARELNNLVKQIQERERLKQLPASQPVAKSDLPVNNVPQAAPASNEELVVNQNPNANSNPRSGAKLAVSNTAIVNDKKPEEVKAQVQLPEGSPVSVQPAVQENQSATNAAAESARKNIRQLVSVQSNKYKTGVLGGISDLSLTVSNKSDFEIDQVEVEVAYLGPEKRVVKTQTIVFNNIKPGNKVTLDVPRTNRGVSVTTNIKVINSRSLGLAHSGI